MLSHVTISSVTSFQGDLFASTFLIKNGALVSAATLGAQETPLHLVASYSSKKHSADVMSAMAQIAEALLQAGANPNMQDSKGRSVGEQTDCSSRPSQNVILRWHVTGRQGPHVLLVRRYAI